MSADNVAVHEGPWRCEAVRESDDQRCSHPAKYLVPFDDRVVCGVHRRAFLRCIPLSDFDCPTPTAGDD